MQEGKIGYTAAAIVMLAAVIASAYIFFRDVRADHGEPEITAEQAKQICLNDSGETLESVTFTKARLEWENRIPVYEVDFYTAEKSYEYAVNAQTGTIRNRGIMVQQKTAMTRDESTVQREEETFAAGNSMDVIGVMKAQEAALEAVGLNREQVVFRQTSLDTDDGETVYEVEFIFEGHEYEFTVDALRGIILEEEIEIPEEPREFTETESGKTSPSASVSSGSGDDDDDDDRDDDGDDDDGRDDDDDDDRDDDGDDGRDDNDDDDERDDDD